MRKSFTLVILAALLCLSGCESVSHVPDKLGPESVSETVMLKYNKPWELATVVNTAFKSIQDTGENSANLMG